MKIRKAESSDIPVLSSLRIAMLNEDGALSERQAALISDNTAQYLRVGMTDGSVCVWVAECEQRIVSMGCVNFFNLPPNDWCASGKTAYIGNMYTLHEIRKRRLAFGVLSQLIAVAKDRGCQRILLNATEMGRPLYEKLGFASSPTAMALYPFGIGE